MKINEKTIIIAEIGECFNGIMENAYKLIDVAENAGCDYAKFQTLDKEGINPDDPEAEWFEKIALSSEQIKSLMDYCENKKIKFLCSPENLKTAKMLYDLGNRAVKIASNCSTDHDMIHFINNNFKKVFLSTGMCSLDMIYTSVNKLDKISDLSILHCISEYPTGKLLEVRGLKPLSENDVNLNMMLILKNIFPQYTIGYSDHTIGYLASICAVAAGAQVIEKHITLDRKKPIEVFNNKTDYLGTDHVLSLEPEELKTFVSKIRKVNKIFGNWKWERTEGEKLLSGFLFGRFDK